MRRSTAYLLSLVAGVALVWAASCADTPTASEAPAVAIQSPSLDCIYIEHPHTYGGGYYECNDYDDAKYAEEAEETMCNINHEPNCDWVVRCDPNNPVAAACDVYQCNPDYVAAGDPLCDEEPPPCAQSEEGCTGGE